MTYILTVIEKSKEQLNDLNIFASILGHIGDGNFHSSILYSRKNPEETARVEKVVHDMVDRAIEMDGSCTVRLIAPQRSSNRLTCIIRANTASV